MKIAQIAPLYESVPPKLYGGTERVVSFLTEELVRQGHDVTLFASGDSSTAATWQATIYHGLPTDLYAFNPDPDDYLAFLGRISVEKRVDRAIEIAGRAGMRLRIAAKVDRADQEYFEAEIKHLLRQPHVD